MLPIKSQIYDNSNEGSFVKIACIVKIICLIFLPPTPCLTLFWWFGIFNSTPKECQISQLATICQLVNMHFHTPQIYSFMKNNEDMCAIASLGRPLKWGPCCSTIRRQKINSAGEGFFFFFRCTTKLHRRLKWGWVPVSKKSRRIWTTAS